MGQQTTKGLDNSLSKQEIYQKYQYIMPLDSPHFGHIKLYRLKVKPHYYIMKFSHQCQSDILHLKFIENYYLSLKQHQSLVKFEHIEYSQKNELCITVEQLCVTVGQLSLYCRYLNFTLEDAINLKLSQKIGYFSESNIIYLFQNLISIAKFYENNKNIINHNFSINKIFLSPQGFIKLYLIYSDQQYKRQKHHKWVAQKQKTQNINNDQKEVNKIKYIRLLGNTKKIDIIEDLIDISVVVLCCIFLKSTQDYIDENGLLNKKQISIDLQQNWSYHYYSGNLKDILYNILIKEQKIKIQKVEDDIQNIKKLSHYKHSYFITFNNTINKSASISQITTQKARAKSRSLLQQLQTQKKLIPSKIQSIKNTTLNSQMGFL